MHFLRNYTTINASQFLSRYYPFNSNNVARRNSLSALSSNNSVTNLIDDNNVIKELLKLQDEAKFYQIDSLDKAIQGMFMY